jgi:hypothetical protein
MINFVIQNLHLCFELSALIASLYFFSYLRGSYMQWFCLFLFLISLLEIAPIIWPKVILATNYLAALYEMVFYGYLANNLASQRKIKVAFSLLVIIMVATFVIGYCFIDTNRSYMFFLAKGLIAMGICISLMYLVLLYQLMNKHGLILQSHSFWIAFGVILFYSGLSFILSLYPYILKNNLTFLGMRLYRLVPRILCGILYTSLIVSFILYRRNFKGRALQNA